MKYSINILVVEDEDIIRNDIVKKIKSLGSQYHIVDAVEDGMHALEILQAESVDLLITDIRMPIMDGLDLLHSINKMNLKIDSIILSGYTDFSYAQKAIQLGVSDYLVKPIKMKVLSEILNKKLLLHSSSITKKRNQELTNIIQGNTFTSQFLDSNENWYIYYVNIGNICNITPSTMTINFYNNIWDTLLSNSIPNTFFRNANIINDTLPTGKFFLLQTKIDFSILSEIQNKLQSYHTVCASIYYTNECASISTIYDIASKLKSAALVCTTFSKGYIIDITSSQINTLSLHNYVPFSHSKESLSFIYLSKENKIEAIRSYLKELLISNLPQTYFCEAISQLLNYCFSYSSTGAIEIPHILYSIYNQLSLPMSHDEIIDFITNESLLFLTDDTTSDINGNELVHSICDYISQNYSEDINLDTLAKKFGYTPSHIIKVFKKTMNCTPINFLIKQRIHKAKYMLIHEPQLSITDISTNIGYSDSHYFSRLFKNETSLTPSEYRRQDCTNN